MGLSTDTLLHQTDFRNLTEIIRNKNFKVSYSKETLECKTPKMTEAKGYKFVFPMISFSEIPISSLHNHLYRYGDCIIGMKKEWAISNRINQVHYYQKESILMDSFLEIYNIYYKEVMENGNKTDEILQVFHHLDFQMIHSKNYSGEVKKKYFEDKNYFFSEEKEWRYVPDNENIGHTLSKKLDVYEKDKEKFQNEIGKKVLRFEFDDIRFLILDTEEQKKDIVHILSKLSHKNHLNLFTNDEVKHNFFGYKNTSMEFYQLKKDNDEFNKKLKNIKL